MDRFLVLYFHNGYSSYVVLKRSFRTKEERFAPPEHARVRLGPHPRAPLHEEIRAARCATRKEIYMDQKKNSRSRGPRGGAPMNRGRGGRPAPVSPAFEAGMRFAL